MGRQPAPMLVTIGGVPFRCQVCQSEEFFDRQVKLMMAGEWNIKWLRTPTCARCGYLHMFMNDAIEFWNAVTGYPRGPESQG